MPRQPPDRGGTGVRIRTGKNAKAEERIVSITYELELVPVVLMQQGLARRPVISELDTEALHNALFSQGAARKNWHRRMGALLASRVERF